jgi:hypothetical protein
MIGVHFSKAYAETVIDALRTGKPIPPNDPNGWTRNDQLMLAGLLYAGIFSQGPRGAQAKGILAEQLAKAHPEYREATEETFVQEIHDGIEFIGMLAFKVMDGEYDADHHPECEAVIFRKDGEQTFFPASGFKNIG